MSKTCIAIFDQYLRVMKALDEEILLVKKIGDVIPENLFHLCGEIESELDCKCIGVVSLPITGIAYIP
jgi:hypothetical protein